VRGENRTEGPRLDERTELDKVANLVHLANPYVCNPFTGLVHDFDPITEGVTRTVCVRDYGGGIVEAGYSSVRSVIDQVNDDSSNSAESSKAEINEDARRLLDAANLDRSVRRSRAQVRRKCMAGGLDYLLTLTYRENMQEPDQAWRDFKQFLRGVRAHFGQIQYVAVIEFQKRGACHIHCAVKGFQQVRVLRALWLAVVGEGNIDVRAPKQRGKTLWQLPKLASYISKYITKSCTDLDGRQRYRVSQNIEIPAMTFVYVCQKGVSLVSELFESLGVRVGFHWEPADRPHGWACSWR
jgi:hypothetical protein